MIAIAMHLLLLSSFFHVLLCQPPTFNPYDFELDGFKVARGYFSALGDRQSCQSDNFGECIYTNWLNPPNILFVPQSSASSTEFTSTFPLKPKDAIVVAGFAPPLSTRFTITPYASITNGEETFASIANNSLTLDSTYFVAVITGDKHTYNLIADWFATANTTLTTAVYNHYLYHIPIVQENDMLHIDQDTHYSVIVRHETVSASQYDLKWIFSQSPSLMAWKVTALNYDETKSKIYTELIQLREPAPNNEWDLSLIPIQSNNEGLSVCKELSINQANFRTANYDSFICLVQGKNCNFDQPESVIFESPKFRTKANKNNQQTKIHVSGINHVSPKNAIYSALNLVLADDDSVLAQIVLNDLVDDAADNTTIHQYEVIFAEDCDDESIDSNLHCTTIADSTLLYGKRLQIVEIISNRIGLRSGDLQPPNVVVTVFKRPTQEHYRISEYEPATNIISDPSAVITEQQAAEFEHAPNIFVIAMDDVGWRDVGYNGAEYETPNIDELAASGIVFNQYYVHPVCTPTRTALFTGRYAFRYNLSIPLDIGQRRYLPPDVDTLPEMMRANGYSTHLVGKWHAGAARWDNFPFSRGFDTFYGISGAYVDLYTHQQCWPDWDSNELISGANNLRLLHAFFPEGSCFYDLFDGKRMEYHEEYLTPLFAERVLEIIREKEKHPETPVFLLWSMLTPHTPIVEPPELYTECEAALEQYGEDRYNYCNMMMTADEQIGRVVNALKDADLWQNTILFFTTDNGGISNAVPGNPVWGSFGSNAPLRGQKDSPFEGGNRGIALLNGGYLDRYEEFRGTVNNKLYHVVDFYDTIICGMAGIDACNHTDTGRDSLNVWNSITQKGVQSPRDEWVWTVNFGASPTAIRQNNWKLVTRPQPYLDGYWDVNDMTMAPGQNESESVYLFDVANDELEAVNLKDVEVNITRGLEVRLEEVKDEGFTESSDELELEGFVIGMLSGSSLPYLELTQEIKIDVD